MTSPTSRRRMPAALLLAFVVLLTGGLLATCGTGQARPLTLIPVEQRQPAPDICGQTTDGEQLCLADLSGTPTLVNFWASWCGPCAREMPELVEVDELYADRVTLIGVNLKDSLTNARTFERDQDVGYPSIFDETSEVAAAFGGIAPEALPSTILLDAEHRVALRLFGAVTRPVLQPHLDALLAEQQVTG